MSVTQTIQLLKPYIEQDSGPLPLSSLFTVPPGGIHNKDKIEFHVSRTSREIATPMRSAMTGYHLNGLKGFSIKFLEPPVYKEGLAISADELKSGRSIGMTPYDSPEIMAQVRDKVQPVIAEIQETIKRAIEFQASQILQSATMTLIDDASDTIFSEDFAPKATHFPNASTTWATTATAVPFKDMADLCDVITTDGKKDPMRAWSNSACFDVLKATTQFMNGISGAYTGEIYKLDTNATPIHPKPTNGGAVFRGVLRIRSHNLDYYTYDGSYNHPETGVDTKYIATTKFIIESGGRMDATFGQLNKFRLDTEAARLVQGGRMANPGKLSDLSYNMWFSDNNEVFNFGCGTRALLAPIAIDTFGCITTTGF